MMEENRGFQLSECPETNWGIVAPNEMTICFGGWMKEGAEPEAGEETLAAVDLAFAQFIVDRAQVRMKERCLVDAETNLWSLFEGKLFGGAFGKSKSLPNDILVTLLGLKSKREVLGEFVRGNQISDEFESLRHALVRV
jgi:hypothetical protein